LIIIISLQNILFFKNCTVRDWWRCHPEDEGCFCSGAAAASVTSNLPFLSSTTTTTTA
jgi:hypothetical protein